MDGYSFTFAGLSVPANFATPVLSLLHYGNPGGQCLYCTTFYLG
jgi:hypothetical protein